MLASVAAGSHALFLRWGGKSWTRAGPTVSDAALSATAASSASNIWAVGRSGSTTLTERWQGQQWKKVPSPGAPDDIMTAVAVRSAADAWAAGEAGASDNATLTERWNGTSWKLVASPDIGAGTNSLTGIAIGGAKSAWTVGSYQRSGGARVLLLHWNGKSWSQQ